MNPGRRVRTTSTLLRWGAGLLVALLSLPAEAKSPRRVAVLISAPQGYADEGRLSFSHADAERIRDTLVELGGFEPKDIWRLKSPSPGEVDRAMDEVSTSVRSSPQVADESLVLVYYSGHGDSESLHLGTEAYALERLRARVEAVEAGLRVLVVDACRSGGLTGVKGAKPTDAFAFEFDDAVQQRGLAVLTSASASEDAQESEQWGGSVFSSALVSALRGAGDFSSDGQVTLHEAYSYAAQATVRNTRRSVSGPQHPTFEFNLRGKQSIPVTWPGRNPDVVGRVTLIDPSTYFFLNADGRIVQEASFSAGVRQVVLPPGGYQIERRTRTSMAVATRVLRAGDHITLRAEEMETLGFEEARAKGAPRGWDLFIGAAGAIQGPTLDREVWAAGRPSMAICCCVRGC